MIRQIQKCIHQILVWWWKNIRQPPKNLTWKCINTRKPTQSYKNTQMIKYNTQMCHYRGNPEIKSRVQWPNWEEKKGSDLSSFFFLFASRTKHSLFINQTDNLPSALKKTRHTFWEKSCSHFRMFKHTLVIWIIIHCKQLQLMTRVVLTLASPWGEEDKESEAS